MKSDRKMERNRRKEIKRGSQTFTDKAHSPVTCESAAVLPKRGSILRVRNVHKGLVERDHNNKQYATRSYKEHGPLWNIESHLINTREKKNEVQENVKTSDFLLRPCFEYRVGPPETT